MKYYLSLYKSFVATSTSVAMSFRTSFFLLIIMDIFFISASLLSVDYIYDHVQQIGGWSKYQLLFFTCFMLVIDQIHMMIFSTNFWVIGDDIKTGQLDYTLLKPSNSLFNCFVRYFRPSAVVTSFVAIGGLVYYGKALELAWHQWTLIPLFMLWGLVLLVIIEIIVSTFMFWLTEGSGINFIRMGLQRVSRYPHFIYGNIARKVFLILVPVLFIGSAPVEFLFNYQSYQLLLGMLLATILLGLLLKKFWTRALNQYESASS